MRPFEPNSVLIPEDACWEDGEGRHADPEKCTLLFNDGDRARGVLYAKEAWETGGVPSFNLFNDEYYKYDDGGMERLFCRAGLGIQDQEPDSATGDRIQLLPDMWVLKIDETKYWEGLKEHKIKRVFGVYVLNKRKAAHLCEMTPSYELTPFDSQYDQGWDADNPNYDKLNEAAFDHIMRGDGEQASDVIYIHCADVEHMLKTEIRRQAGDLPAGHAGGYHIDGVVSVTEEDALAEIREATRNGDL